MPWVDAVVEYKDSQRWDEGFQWLESQDLIDALRGVQDLHWDMFDRIAHWKLMDQYFRSPKRSILKQLQTMMFCEQWWHFLLRTNCSCEAK
jgi:hypothetical protein